MSDTTLTAEEAVDLLETIGRPVPNQELANWLGMPEDATPEDVLLTICHTRPMVFTNWDKSTESWFWDYGPDSPGAHNRSPLEPAPTH